MKIAIETTVNASAEAAWTAWTSPQLITQWNFASGDWVCPRARKCQMESVLKYCCTKEPFTEQIHLSDTGPKPTISEEFSLQGLLPI